MIIRSGWPGTEKVVSDYTRWFLPNLDASFSEWPGPSCFGKEAKRKCSEGKKKNHVLKLCHLSTQFLSSRQSSQHQRRLLHPLQNISHIRGPRSIVSHCPLMSSHKGRADLSSLVALVVPINSASKACFSSTVFFEDVGKEEALLFQCRVGFVGN